MRTAQLPIESLADITVGELLSAGYGTNLVMHVKSSTSREAGLTTPSPKGVYSLPDSLQSMMDDANAGFGVLPPRATGSYLKHTIFNAIMDELKSLSLGWHHVDANGTGRQLITALSTALQYVLPFDANGAFKRRSIHIPECFKLEHLKVC